MTRASAAANSCASVGSQRTPASPTISGISGLPITILLLLLSARSGRLAQKFGPRIFLVGLPVICVLVRRTGIRALAPIGVVLALMGHLSFEIPLNVGAQWHALVRDGADTTELDAYLRSSDFTPGATYRVLRGGDAEDRIRRHG